MYVDALIGMKMFEPHGECFNVTSRESAIEEIQAQLDEHNKTLKPEQEKRYLFGVIEEMDITNNRQFHNRAITFYNMIKRESSRTSGDEWCKENSTRVHVLMLLAGKKPGIGEMQNLIRKSPFKNEFEKMLEYEAQDDE